MNITLKCFTCKELHKNPDGLCPNCGSSIYSEATELDLEERAAELEEASIED